VSCDRTQTLVGNFLGYSAECILSIQQKAGVDRLPS
jgi:hypothetical protein